MESLNQLLIATVARSETTTARVNIILVSCAPQSNEKGQCKRQLLNCAWRRCVPFPCARFRSLEVENTFPLFFYLPLTDFFVFTLSGPFQ